MICLPLSDTNGDGVLDEQELEALFTKEVTRRWLLYVCVCMCVCMHVCVFNPPPFSAQLEKMYDPKNEEDDMVEMGEERLRMREHVMKNVSLYTPGPALNTLGPTTKHHAMERFF